MKQFSLGRSLRLEGETMNTLSVSLFCSTYTARRPIACFVTYGADDQISVTIKLDILSAIRHGFNLTSAPVSADVKAPVRRRRGCVPRPIKLIFPDQLPVRARHSHRGYRSKKTEREEHSNGEQMHRGGLSFRVLRLRDV